MRRLCTKAVREAQRPGVAIRELGGSQVGRDYDGGIGDERTRAICERRNRRHVFERMEQTFERRRMEIQGDVVLNTHRPKDVRRDGRPEAVVAGRTPVLACVAKVRHDRRDTCGPPATAGIGNEREFHEMLVHGRAGWLDDADVTLSHVTDLNAEL